MTPIGTERSRGLRELIARPELCVVPGVPHALGAKLVAATGFEAVCLTGAGMALSLLGEPDRAAMTGNDLVTIAASVARSVEIPVIVEVTASGDPSTVRRMVQALIRAGVAGAWLADDPGARGPGEHVIARLRAAREAREVENPDFMIIAGAASDRAGDGSPEAIRRRGRAYVEAGADAVMASLPSSSQLDVVASGGDGLGGMVLCVSALADAVDHEALERAGVGAVIYPSAGWRFGVAEVSSFLDALQAHHDRAIFDYHDRVVDHPLGSVAGWHAFAGFAEGLAWLERYSPSEPSAGAGWRPS